MFLQSSFVTEFLSESNLVLAQEDYGNKLADIYAPIKNVIQSEQEILSFSLARYCGASSRVAFICEWLYQSHILTNNSAPLETATEEYLRKKVPVKFRGIDSLHTQIAAQIPFLTSQQISFLHIKLREMIQDILPQHTYLTKYFNSRQLASFRGFEWQSRKLLFTENYLQTTLLESYEMREGFVRVGMPCLLGFLYMFNQPGNPINVNAIKWVTVEEIFKGIGSLYQTANSKEFLEMLYLIKLNDKEKFEWFSLSYREQNSRIFESMWLKRDAADIRLKWYQKITNQISHLVFPDKYKSMLTDLAEWSLSLDTQLTEN